MMAALGVASRPAVSRTRARKVSSTRSQVPSSRQLRKYHHTVPQGGPPVADEAASALPRQEVPPRSKYRMLLTTSRSSVVLGCPLLVSGGNNGANSSHCASVPPQADWDKVFCSCHQPIQRPTITPSILHASFANCHTPSNITVALVEQRSEGVSCNDSAWPGPDAAVSSLTNGWSGWDCHEAATAAGIAVV